MYLRMFVNLCPYMFVSLYDCLLVCLCISMCFIYVPVCIFACALCLCAEENVYLICAIQIILPILHPS